MSGALSTTLLLALFAVTALRPPIPRHASPFTLSFALSWWINEAPAMALWWLLAGTLATLTSPEASVWWWLIVALSAADLVLFASLAFRGRSARPVLSAALQGAYGPRAAPPRTPVARWLLAGTLATLTSPEASVWWWLIVALSAADLVLFASLAFRGRSARPVLSAALQSAYGPRAEPPRTPLPWWRLPLPIVSWRPDVRRIGNRRYGPARRGHRLDVYVSRAPRKAPAPVLVYFHAGTSSKMIGAHPLIYRL